MNLDEVKWSEILGAKVGRKPIPRPNLPSLAPGLQSRRPGARRLPRDGDGDGKFAPFKGAPDETPMPPGEALTAIHGGRIVKVDGLKSVFNLKYEVQPEELFRLRPGVEHPAQRARFAAEADRRRYGPLLEQVGRIHGVDPNDDVVLFTILEDDVRNHGQGRGVKALVKPRAVGYQDENKQVIRDPDGKPVKSLYAELIVGRGGSSVESDWHFLHEFGHRIDIRLDENGNLTFWTHTDTPAMNAFFEAVQNLPNHEDRVNKLLQVPRDKQEYYWSRHEVFARAYAQWVATKMKRQDIIDLVENKRTGAGQILARDPGSELIEFSAEEIEILSPFIDALMRERGLY